MNVCPFIWYGIAISVNNKRNVCHILEMVSPILVFHLVVFNNLKWLSVICMCIDTLWCCFIIILYCWWYCVSFFIIDYTQSLKVTNHNNISPYKKFDHCMKNNANRPMSSKSHPSATANKARHCLKWEWGTKPTGTSYNFDKVWSDAPEDRFGK